MFNHSFLSTQKLKCRPTESLKYRRQTQVKIKFKTISKLPTTPRAVRKQPQYRHKTNNIKPRLNDRNMATQHIATLLGATCYVRLATVLRCVAMCCDMLAVVGSSLTIFKLEPTTPNTSQRGGQTHTTCCAQQCCDMLCWRVAIVWPGLKA